MLWIEMLSKVRQRWVLILSATDLVGIFQQEAFLVGSNFYKEKSSLNGIRVGSK